MNTTGRLFFFLLVLVILLGSVPASSIAAVIEGDIDTDNVTFARDALIASVTIDSSKFTTANVEFTNEGEQGDSMGGVKPMLNNGRIYFPNLTMKKGKDDSQNNDGWKKAGNFTLKYLNAAVLSDGTRKDLVLQFKGVWLSSRRNIRAHSDDLVFPYEDSPVIFSISGNQGNPIPSVTGYSEVGRHFGFKIDSLIVKVDGAKEGDTFFYTLYGLNIDRSKVTPDIDSNPFADLTFGINNNYFSEKVWVQSGTKDDIYIPYQSKGTRLGENNTFGPVQGTSNTSYENGFAVVADALNGLSARMWQSAPQWTSSDVDKSTDFFLMPDGITHTITSSSGFGGKIETTKTGNPGGDMLDGDPLYGGRFVEGSIEEKRTYDVPNGKTVIYTLTPEDNYIIDKLIVNGQNVQPTSTVTDPNNFYYTYEFPAYGSDGFPVTTDQTIHVTWKKATGPGGGSAGTLPRTGFAPGRVTKLQPMKVGYDRYAQLVLRVPALGVEAEIMGVPMVNGDWDVSWLGDRVGWLQNTAYPGSLAAGNTVITGHSVNYLGRPGVFYGLENLGYGSTITIHAYGETFTYTVLDVQTVYADTPQVISRQTDLPMLTLITCKYYNAALDQYDGRIVVSAVLSGIQ